MSQSAAVGDDGDVEALVAKLHRDHGVPGFVVSALHMCNDGTDHEENGSLPLALSSSTTGAD